MKVFKKFSEPNLEIDLGLSLGVIGLFGRGDAMFGAIFKPNF